MLKKEDIQKRIKENYPMCQVLVKDLTGTENYWQIHISTPEFKDLQVIEQHRQIKSLFKKELKTGEIHALSLKTSPSNNTHKGENPMNLNQETKTKIENVLNQKKIVLFMKGTPEAPQCGFSAKVVEILNACDVEFSSINVLDDDKIREGVKVYGNWPTIPQLYVSKNLIGGCDIVMDMFQSGELQKILNRP